MMKPETLELQLDGVTYRLLANDFNYFEMFERLTGVNALERFAPTASLVLAALWSAIYAEAASRGVDPPITKLQLGGMLNTPEKHAAALELFWSLYGTNKPDPAPEDGKKQDPLAAARPNRSQRRAATKSRRSTSESQSASSGP